MGMTFKIILCLAWISLFANAYATNSFVIGSYNLDNYLLEPGLKRQVKPPEARAQIQQSILSMKADILALQEVGSINSLSEIRSRLRQAGLDYAYGEYAQGYDTNTAVAILSRFPITAHRSNTNLSYLLNGRRFHVHRAFAEVDVSISSRYQLTVINVHLKSRRPTAEGDESELRQQEAICLREIIDARLSAHPQINLVVLGDLNDTQEAASTRIIIGKGPRRLIDIRPAEALPDPLLKSLQIKSSLRPVNWTYYYAKADTYSRIDYILISQGLAKEWIRQKSLVIALPAWGLASDHRPILATFSTREH